MAFNQPIKCLSALVSLTFLKISSSLELLSQASSASLSNSNSINLESYILDQPVTTEINDILISMAATPTASPTILAWSIITQTLREVALATRDSREMRQSIRAADKFGAADSSDTDGSERPVTRSMSAIRRRSSTSSDTSQQSTLIEEIYDSICITAIDDDPIAYLAKNSVEDGKVFDVIATIATEYCTPYGFEHHGTTSRRMRLCLLDLLKASVQYLEYQPGLIAAIMAVVTGSERYWDLLDEPSLLNAEGPAALLRQDEVMKTKIFLVALSRFPYETMPLLELCRALAYEKKSSDPSSEIWLSLQELDMFTCMLPSDYQNYRNIREDEECDFVELTEDYICDLTAVSKSDVSQSSGRKLLLRGSRLQASMENHIQIPRGTQGQVLSNNKPLVVAWNYEYSGLAYIGKILQCACTSNLPNESLVTAISIDVVGEAIGFITTMLLSVVQGTAAKQDSMAMHESASVILGQASDGLDRNEDVVSVIFQIFENDLYKPRRVVGDEHSLDLLVQCVQFAHAVLPIMPDRVWPFLGRSGLLGNGKDGGRLSAMISTYEIISGRYGFLIGCIRLYDALVEDVVSNAVSRRTPTKAVTRFGDLNHVGTGIPKDTMQNVLLSLQRIMMDVFDSLQSWKFADPDDKAEIASWLCIIFKKLLDYSFSTNDDPKTSSHVTSALMPAATVILDVFLSASKTDLAIDPLLKFCKEGLGTTSLSIPSRGDRFHISKTMSSLQLLSLLIATSDFLGRNSTHLQRHLFKSAGVFARLYGAKEAFRIPVVQLLDTLVLSASSSIDQPPSLLGHVGQEDAADFLELLSVLDQPIGDNGLAIAIWKFLTSVVSSRQQWFAHFVLTGSTPRNTLKSNDDSPTADNRRAQPILDIALDQLCSVESLEPQKALEMFRFVALAADFWPQIFTTLNKHPNFLISISQFASRLGSTSGDTSFKTSGDYNGMRMASYIADILCLYAHWTQQESKPRFAQELLKHLTYLAKNAITVPSYNASLHTNLRQNFARRFPGCSLNDFQRTSLENSTLGESYFYDLGLASKMLSSDSAWTGKKGQGFEDEIRRANFNLSVVEAQVVRLSKEVDHLTELINMQGLFQSWKSLLIELIPSLIAEAKFQKIMCKTVTDCLQANCDNSLPEVFFERLGRSRSDLAFTLLESLNRAKCAEMEVLDILPTAWTTLRSHYTDIGTAFATLDADYHRMLIKLLYLAVQVHTADYVPSLTEFRSQNSNTVTLALEIISTTVAQGFRSLSNLLHESSNLVSPSDFLILTALLRSCLRVPNVARNSEHLMNSFADCQTPRCASTMLSWSDQLATSTSGDPIYGEVSVMFLLELSTVPALAETLAVEGVLSYILTTNIVGLLQSKEYGPFDTPPRMYIIWSRGILPLLLNLLHAVGPPIAAEVAAALNTFPHQLSRAGQAFGTSTRSTVLQHRPNGEAITLSIAQEAQCLALIVNILRTFREAGASAAVIASQVEDIKWDAAQVKDDIEGWLQRRGALRDRIVPTNEREEAWMSMKPDKGEMGESRLEENIMVEMMGVVGILGNTEA